MSTETKEVKRVAESTETSEEVKGLVDESDMDPVTLASKEKATFTVPRKYAKISTLVKSTLDVSADAHEVPIPDVSSPILKLVVEYMNAHKGVEPLIIEKPLRSKIMADVVKVPSDAVFIDRVGENLDNLYALIAAANYMDIKSLLHLGCAKVASKIKGQPLEKIKEILGTDKAESKTESKTESKA